jgi:hypothetical protein
MYLTQMGRIPRRHGLPRETRVYLTQVGTIPAATAPPFIGGFTIGKMDPDRRMAKNKAPL